MRLAILVRLFNCNLPDTETEQWAKTRQEILTSVPVQNVTVLIVDPGLNVSAVVVEKYYNTASVFHLKLVF